MNSQSLPVETHVVMKEDHDALLAERPEGGTHIAEECEFCNPELASTDPENQGGFVKTYTEEEYNSALAQVAALETKVSELQEARQESEVEAKVAELSAQHEAAIAELQGQLDSKVLEVEAAKNEKDEALNYLTALAEETTRTEEIARLRDERINRVKETVSFPDSHISERADAWAEMDEAAFEAALNDWKAIAPKAGHKEEIPVTTAMTASADPNSGNSVLREVLGFRAKGIDTRTV